MTTEHKYAHILRAIADGKAVQWQDSRGIWMNPVPSEVLEFIASDSYSPDRYRIKPRTININGYEVPEPVREPLDFGTNYWLSSVNSDYPFTKFMWADQKTDRRWLCEGRIHLTQEAAELHSKALLSFTAKK